MDLMYRRQMETVGSGCVTRDNSWQMKITQRKGTGQKIGQPHTAANAKRLQASKRKKTSAQVRCRAGLGWRLHTVITRRRRSFTPELCRQQDGFYQFLALQILWIQPFSQQASQASLLTPRRPRFHWHRIDQFQHIITSHFVRIIQACLFIFQK